MQVVRYLVTTYSSPGPRNLPEEQRVESVIRQWTPFSSAKALAGREWSPVSLSETDRGDRPNYCNNTFVTHAHPLLLGAEFCSDK